jgi:hypothetical protein
MRLESRIKRIEDQLTSKEQREQAESERLFAGWTKEDIARYALTGIKPEKAKLNAAMW